jgi:hypothetical protein
VLQAVGRDLVHRQHEVEAARCVEAELDGTLGNEMPHRGERLGGERELERVVRRRRKRLRELRRDSLEALVVAVRARSPVLAEEGMAAAGLLEDVLRKRLRVVRADEPERVRVGEGEVQERLVPLALDELVRAALGEDRLADPPAAARRAPSVRRRTRARQG